MDARRPVRLWPPKTVVAAPLSERDTRYGSADTSTSAAGPLRVPSTDCRDYTEALLEISREPLFIVDREARVQRLNQLAADLLAIEDPICIQNSRLAAVSHAQTLQIRSTISDLPSELAATARASTTLSNKGGDSIRLQMATCHRMPAEAGRSFVIVSVHDSSTVASIDSSALQAAYGLTLAEAVLVELLANGHSLESAADELCVSIHTVRTHIKRIFLKTGACRQSELISRVLRTFAF